MRQRLRSAAQYRDGGRGGTEVWGREGGFGGRGRLPRRSRGFKVHKFSLSLCASPAPSLRNMRRYCLRPMVAEGRPLPSTASLRRTSNVLLQACKQARGGQLLSPWPEVKRGEGTRGC